MIDLHRTAHIEQAANALAKQHKHVVARAVYVLERPIRLRANLLQVEPNPSDPLERHVFFSRYNSPHDSQIQQWFSYGGVLVNHITNSTGHHHDALLFVECPISLDIIEDQTRCTGKIACVYRPPTWGGHEELIHRTNPPVDLCRRFAAVIQGAKLSRDHASLCRLLAIPTEGLAGITHNALAEQVGVSYRDVRHLHRKTLAAKREGYFEIQPLIPRIEPEEPALAALYKFIRDGLPDVAGVRYAVNNALSKAVKMWRIPLRALVRGGCVEKGEKIGFYVKDQVRPVYETIDAEHQLARTKLQKLVKAVEASPDLLRARRAPARSSAARA